MFPVIGPHRPVWLPPDNRPLMATQRGVCPILHKGRIGRLVPGGRFHRRGGRRTIHTTSGGARRDRSSEAWRGRRATATTALVLLLGKGWHIQVIVLSPAVVRGCGLGRLLWGAILIVTLGSLTQHPVDGGVRLGRARDERAPL